MSQAGPILLSGPAINSGGMYAGVPEPSPAVVASGKRPLPSPKGNANPQSSTMVSPNPPSITFSGLRSRLTMCRECANAIASETFISTSMFSSSVMSFMRLCQPSPRTHFIV